MVAQLLILAIVAFVVVFSQRQAPSVTSPPASPPPPPPPPKNVIAVAPQQRSDLIFDPANRRVNVPTQLVRGQDPRLLPQRELGVVHSTDPMDDTVFILLGKEYPRDPNRWQYRVLLDRETGISIPLNGGDPMKELFDGDQISIATQESVGDFTVLLNDNSPFLPLYL